MDQHPVHEGSHAAAPNSDPYGNRYGAPPGYPPAPVPVISTIGDLSASYGISIFFRRWAATVIDFLLIASYFLILLLVPEHVQLMVVFVIMLLIMMYYLILEGFTGMTVGKLALRIQVVDENGRAPGFIKSLIRFVTRIFETNPLLMGGLPAGIAVLATRKNQRLGDLGASTYVVRSRDLVRNRFGTMAAVIGSTVVLVGLSLYAILAGITAAAGTDWSADKTYFSKDGRFQVAANGGWGLKRDLHEEADLAIGNLLRGKYFILFTESKDDFYSDTTLEDYTYWVEDNYAYEMESSPIYWPRELQVNGYPAYQFSYEAVDDDVSAVFIITTVETRDHFHQLIVWVLSENFEREKDNLYKLIESFTEVGRGQLI